MIFMSETQILGVFHGQSSVMPLTELGEVSPHPEP